MFFHLKKKRYAYYFNDPFIILTSNFKFNYVSENEGIITSIAKTTSTADVISISSNPSGSFEVDISKPNSIETRNKVRSILRQKFGKYLLNWFI